MYLWKKIFDFQQMADLPNRLLMKRIPTNSSDSNIQHDTTYSLRQFILVLSQT